ncbi:chloramphenicol acetyltransferase [Bdellovibrio sp. qaytius]|nr:chloramphenicol acetyltransferase [Bdellovibrio sp. qaytius]
MKNYIRNVIKNWFRKPSDPQIMPNSRVSHDSQIGNYTYIGYNCMITKTKIGNYCSIANNISIGLGEHELNKISTSSYFYGSSYQELTKNECTIGHDVWIGVDAIIRRGVKIGNGAVIGANSFVNTDVPDYAIVVGTPAKIIKYRFTPEVIKEITQTQWWNKNLDEAKVILEQLQKKI